MKPTSWYPLSFSWSPSYPTYDGVHILITCYTIQLSQFVDCAIYVAVAFFCSFIGREYIYTSVLPNDLIPTVGVEMICTRV